MPRTERMLIQSTSSISMSQVKCFWACKWETPWATCLAWKQQHKVVLSTMCFLAVASKLGFFWLLKSAIAAARALLLTMVARCREMGAQKVGGGRISAVVVWWRGHLNAKIIYIKHIIVGTKNHFKQFVLKVKFDCVIFNANKLIKNLIWKLQILSWKINKMFWKHKYCIYYI